MKALRVLVGTVLAAACTIAAAAARLPASPDFFLYPVADASRGGAAILTMLAGLLAGLTEDALTVPARLLGLHAFAKILIGYLLATLGARTVVEKPLAVGLLLSGAVLLESGILLVLLWLLRGQLLPPRPEALAWRVAATGLVGAALHHASRVPWRARREARRRRRLS
ncbi:MAG TPA: rod shape-determining protein MreD [Thermoanaerobaculia bacterium]|nr:rod shape-determining protein MreD [Thermoanaerobaculia bacterium]